MNDSWGHKSCRQHINPSWMVGLAGAASGSARPKRIAARGCPPTAGLGMAVCLSAWSKWTCVAYFAWSFTARTSHRSAVEDHSYHNDKHNNNGGNDGRIQLLFH